MSELARQLWDAHKERLGRINAAAMQHQHRKEQPVKVAQPMTVRLDEIMHIIPMPPEAPEEPPRAPFSAQRVSWGCYVPPFEAIKREVLKDYPRVTLRDLDSASRVKEFMIPRKLAMYLCVKVTGKSRVAIGRAFGGKDHSCIFNAVNKIEIEMERSPIFAAHVVAIRERIERNIR